MRLFVRVCVCTGAFGGCKFSEKICSNVYLVLKIQDETETSNVNI